MILVGLGGNLPSARFGSPVRTLTAALAELEARRIGIAARSSWYRSEPVPRSDQPWFVNAVAALDTGLAAADLLALMQSVEAQFGRVRSMPNAARTLDLDLLDHNGALVETPHLVLPHPRLHLRRFVLMPLAEVAPGWRHPRLGLGAAELLARLPAAERVERLPCDPDSPAADCARSTGPI
ncbi:MAG TPA: 2-amino-4-hydroxy-6-hydroxymethyldihydropteridine diphosphokinase [Stellaceae bacterium]